MNGWALAYGIQSLIDWFHLFYFAKDTHGKYDIAPRAPI